MSVDCLIAYDHNDDDGYCAACGWSVDAPKPEPIAQFETGLDRVRAAIERDRGMSQAPTKPILFSSEDLTDEAVES